MDRNESKPITSTRDDSTELEAQLKAQLRGFEQVCKLLEESKLREKVNQKKYEELKAENDKVKADFDKVKAETDELRKKVQQLEQEGTGSSRVKLAQAADSTRTRDYGGAGYRVPGRANGNKEHCTMLRDMCHHNGTPEHTEDNDGCKEGETAGRNDEMAVRRGETAVRRVETTGRKVETTGRKVAGQSEEIAGRKGELAGHQTEISDELVLCGPPDDDFGYPEETSWPLYGHPKAEAQVHCPDADTMAREKAGSLAKGAHFHQTKERVDDAEVTREFTLASDVGNKGRFTPTRARDVLPITLPGSKGDGRYDGFFQAGTTENDSPKAAREKGSPTDGRTNEPDINDRTNETASNGRKNEIANNVYGTFEAEGQPRAGRIQLCHYHAGSGTDSRGRENGIKSPAGSESSSGSRSYNSSFSRISISNSSRSSKTHREDSTQAFGSYNFVPDVGGYTMDKHDNGIGRNNRGASESRSAGTPSSAASSFSVISDPNASNRMSAANTSAVFDDPLLCASSANSSSTPVDAREWGRDHLSGPPANKNINDIQKRKQQASEDEKKAQDTSEDINEVQHARETAKECNKPYKKPVYTSLTQLEMPAIEGEDNEETSKHDKHQMSPGKQEGSSMGMKAEIEEPVEEEANETITNEPDLVDENAHLKEKGSPHSDAKLEMEDRSESTLKKTAHCEMQLEEPMDKSQGEPVSLEELLEDVEESAATHESAPQTIASMMNSNLLQQSEPVEMSSSVNVEETKNALMSVLGGGELGPPTTELAVEISHYVVKVVKMEKDNQAMKVTIDNISSELRKKESELRKKECELREKESELSQKEAFIQQLLKERDPEQKKEGRGAEEGGVARGIDGGASGGEEKGGEAKLELSEAAGGASEAGGAGGAGGHDQPKLMVKSQLQESQEWIALENVNTFRQELTAKDKEINDMKKAIEKKDKRLAKLLEANTAWDKHCTQQERDHKQQVRQVQQEKLQVQDVLQQMKQDNTSLLNQLQEAQMLAARRQRQRDELRSQVSESEARVQELEQRASQLQEVISALNSDARSLRMNSLSQTTPSKGAQGLQHMSKNELITMIEVLQQQVTVCAEDFEREREDRARAQAEKDELTAQLRTVNQVLQRADRTVEEIGREKETLQRLLEQKTAEHRELERRFNALTEERRGGHAGAEERAGPTAPPHPPPPGYAAPPPPPPPGYIDEAPPSYHTMYTSGARNPMLPPITPPPVAGGGGRRAGNNSRPAPAAIEAAPGPPWQCSTCTYVNVPRLRICEMCEMPRGNNDVV